MSAMEPLYGIPAVLRYGIMAIEKWDDKEIIERVILEVRELLNEHATKLNDEEVTEVVSYVDDSYTLLGDVLESYTKMGYSLHRKTIIKYAKKGIFLIDGIDLEKLIKEEKEKKSEPVEFSPEENFMRHVTADSKEQIYANIISIYLQQYLLRIAKEELAKYLGENKINSEEKTLNRTQKDID